MSAPRCPEGFSLDRLLAYHRRDLPADEEPVFEEHLFSCESCVRRLEFLEGLRAAVVEVVTAGDLLGAATVDLLERAEAQGVRIRTYRLGPSGQVACTAAPEDDFVVLRLSADFEGVERVDLHALARTLPTGEEQSQVLEDLVVDRERSELVVLYPGTMIRSLPRTRWKIQVHGRGHQGETVLGTYELDHWPWEERPPGL